MLTKFEEDYNTCFELFAGKYYWKWTDNQFDTTVQGYPKLIANTWDPELENIDTAYTIKCAKTAKTYFFKGAKFWMYTGTRMNE